MISLYCTGYPCKIVNVLGRIVGESEKGSWGDVSGKQMFSVPQFCSPHGTVIEAGISHFEDMSMREYDMLLKLELDATEPYNNKLTPEQQGIMPSQDNK